MLPYWLAVLTRLGMTNLDALRAATSVAAVVCGLTGRKGRLIPGADADVLAVTGDPLGDIRAIHDVVAVFRAGRQGALIGPPSTGHAAWRMVRYPRVSAGGRYGRAGGR